MTTRQFASFLLALIMALFVLMMMAACGPNYHLRRAEHHIKKAKLKGADWSSDTLFKKLSFKVPGVSVEFTPKILTSGEPMIFEKDGVITEVQIKPGLPGKPDSIKVKTDCPPQTITKEVPISINNSIKAGRSLWADISIWLLIALAFFTLGYWARDGPRLFKIVVDNSEKPSP
jgi:hypothetical protein